MAVRGIQPVDATRRIHRPYAALRIRRKTLHAIRAQALCISGIVAIQRKVAPLCRQLGNAAFERGKPESTITITHRFEHGVAWQGTRHCGIFGVGSKIAARAAQVQPTTRADPQFARSIRRLDYSVDDSVAQLGSGGNDIGFQIGTDTHQAAPRADHQAAVAGIDQGDGIDRALARQGGEIHMPRVTIGIEQVEADVAADPQRAVARSRCIEHVVRRDALRIRSDRGESG